ncbi:MAG: hypothetical protein GY850_03870 [bacterium]|nr:hypothetical protein [bacterium]
MKHFKLIVLLSVFGFISAVAWAGNTPEYDTVGSDIINFHSANNGIYGLVNNGPNAVLEYYSYFVTERFSTNAGQSKPTPCSQSGYGSLGNLTDVWNEGTYEWWITLQMKPESDIDLNIYPCVLKHNETDLFSYAGQTGSYRQPWGELVFNPLYSPLVYAEVIPGPYATTGFALEYSITGEAMVLDARVLPKLVPVALDGAAYTSKAHWPEGIVMAMPKTGNTNQSGQNEYNLKQGDIIHVTVEIPPNTNTVDVWYGADSVLLKYIGIIGSEYFVTLEVN